MRDLTHDIADTTVPQGCARIWWLGQAGFVFKSGGGTVIYLDPYLSDLVERLAGFRRLTPKLVEPEDVRADWIISSHEHEDHLDIDALPVIARHDPGCRFAGPRSCEEAYRDWGLASDRQLIIEPGDVYALGDVTVHTSRADHGELSPSALALLFDFGKVRVFFTGDTALSIDLLQPLIDLKPDVILPCINGAYGNMNAHEAAELVEKVRPQVVIPCHFWMFSQHHTMPHNDPQSFIDRCGELCPDVKVELLTPGVGLVLTGSDG
jgi:L-ascorbate 6-phosphate lactonase